MEIPLPDASVHCVVTSPPYWGAGLWAGPVGRRGCWVRGHSRILSHPTRLHRAFRKYSPDAINPQYVAVQYICMAQHSPVASAARCYTPRASGWSPTLGEWVENIVAVMREVKAEWCCGMTGRCGCKSSGIVIQQTEVTRSLTTNIGTLETMGG